ncbi:hypothetical protein OHA77_06160 [Streptosporangium sp. NBC_01639]|uniref:hypothetical protein n=1 Tax=Streptosporangium sp. NBC_01639 TaxID=2975948 RepID=UPI00386CE204|nr:hypothetical protein OHA77_06160 [Streptosporangium sp. NBC_01639]
MRAEFPGLSTQGAGLRWLLARWFNAARSAVVQAGPDGSAQPERRPSVVGKPVLETSFDDGATWQPIKVKHGSAKVKTPRTTGFVSLRVTVSGTAGDAVRQTIIRAYGVRS